MTVSERLRSLRIQKGMTQEEVGKYVGATKQNIYKYETGVIENIPISKIEKFARLYGVTPSYILGWEDENGDLIIGNAGIKNIVPIQKKKIPLLGNVAAGEPIYADQHIEEYLPVDDDMNADFALRIEGDSMINAGIEDGNIVFIRKQPDVNDGQIAAVLVDDGATVKRVYKFDSYVQLMPENPKYKPMIFNDENCGVCKILGLVVAVLKRIG